MDMFAKLTSLIAGQTRRLARDESGATAIEYAMIASVVSAVIAGAVTALGLTVTGLYQSVLSLF